ncbi:MAG: YggS family pyridoxal phosphate-dependent enzyme [Ruminococcaceae bacterium]|nr:YggS family pyridoxal phosphate-dependent enzyme [Oscillospiraceae bacterium]
MDYGYLDRNVAQVRERIKAAEASVGRSTPVTMVAAVKYADIGEINYLHDVLGVNDIGENRVQQLLEHYEGLNDKNINLHFIGTLQTNKVKYIADKVCMIHSVDSVKLAKEIDKQAKKCGRVMDILVEINSGEEESKSGVLPSEAEALCMEISVLENIRLRGFMTMAPRCDKKQDYLNFFGQTYAQVLDIWTKKLHNIDVPIISMGMSESFEEAIASGADTVRIGRCLFVK